MGTSRSFRAPASPRWQAFAAALVGETANRTRSEFFNASQDWLQALASASVSSYAISLGDLYVSFPDRLTASERPAFAVSEVLAEAKSKSRELGLSSADVFAERAFASVVLETVGGVAGDGGGTGQDAAKRWTDARGDSREQLVGHFVSVFFRQFASHFADRQAGMLVENGQSATTTARSTADFSDHVAEMASKAWRQTGLNTRWTAELWSRVVAETVASGTALPDLD